MHLLGLGHALVDDLIDGRLDERGRNALASPLSTSIVGERVGVVVQVSTQVGSELADSGHYGLVHQRRPIENVQQAIQPGDSFSATAMPQAALDRFDPP